MKIGITYDLKIDPAADGAVPPGLPDDFQEEFDSPATIEAIASVIRDLGHDVILLGDGRELLQRLLDQPPDFVFNFAEGQGISRSREARVPAVLEMLGIPYTGSDPLTMAVTLDKDCAKRLAASAGIAVPRALVLQESLVVSRPQDATRALVLQESLVVSRPQDATRARNDKPLTFPVIVKPAWEGSSKGIRNKCLVDRPEDLPEVVESLRGDHRQPILIEEYIQGDELTVGVLGNEDPQILGIMRVVPAGKVERFIYSLEVKRDYRKQVRYECPAPLTPDATAAVRDAALAIYRVLGCRDVARIDFRLRDGIPYFLEVNPLPGLNPLDSDLVIMADLVGWSYSRLIEAILDAAFQRHNLGAKHACLTDHGSLQPSRSRG